MGKVKLAERPLGIGKTDNYQAGLNVDWLGEAEIATVNVTANGVTVSNAAFVGPFMQVTLTGQSAGIHEIHWSYTLNDGRSGCDTTAVRVKDC